MQRTLLVCGGSTNNTYSGTGSVVTYYSPLGSCDGPVGALATAPAGKGAYGRSNFACILSKLYIAIGRVYGASAMSVTAKINVGGTTPAAGNLSCGNPAALNSGAAYYYDATDVDAITAGQQIGMQETLSAGTASAIATSRGVICDCLNQGFGAPYMSDGPVVYNVNPRYSGVCGYASFSSASAIAASQMYASYAFLASGLQWQTATGNTDTATAVAATFAHNPSLGTNTDSSMNATIQSAGFVGQMYDATDVAAVPAGDYYGLHWTGDTSGNTLKVANAGIHMQGASNNACAMLSWASYGDNWATRNPTYGCFNQGSRYDYVWYETITVVPASGVFSSLYVNVASNTYASPTTFTVLNGPTSGDTGTGSGVAPNDPHTAGGFASTSLVATATAKTAGWFYDATDIAAFVGGTNQLLLEANGAVGGATLQAQAVKFTAPAHLGLMMQGVG